MPKSCEIIYVEITFQFKITALFKFTSATTLVCLQLLKHVSCNLYLTVSTYSTTWGISSTIDEIGAMIVSGSSGGSCPTCPSNAVSGRLGWMSWHFFDDAVGKWEKADIVVTCVTHSHTRGDLVSVCLQNEQ